MYVCVCVYKYDLLHTPQHLDFFFYSVVSIHLHEDICLKLHLLDDLLQQAGWLEHIQHLNKAR